jgi:GT2 family glycosyltransferase
MEIKSLDILICNFNSGNLIEKCVNSISKLNHIEINIFIYDNCSSDISLNYLKSICNSRITVYFGDKNIGYGKAINFLYKKSNSSFIFILNPDSEILFDSTDFFKNINNPESKIFGFKILNIDFTSQKFIGTEPNISWIFGSLLRFSYPFYFEKIYNYYFRFNKNFDKSVNIKFVSGCALFMERKTFCDIGMFNEEYFLYFEDTELLRKAYDKGYFITKTDLPIMHNASYSFNKADNFIKVEKYRSCLIYFKNNYGYASFIFANLIIFFFSIVGLLNPINLFRNNRFNYFYNLLIISISNNRN